MGNVIETIIAMIILVRADINLHIQIHVVTVILIVWKQLVVLVVIHGVRDVINVMLPEAVLSVLRRYVILLAVLFMRTALVVTVSVEGMLRPLIVIVLVRTLEENG